MGPMNRTKLHRMKEVPVCDIRVLISNEIGYLLQLEWWQSVTHHQVALLIHIEQ